LAGALPHYHMVFSQQNPDGAHSFFPSRTQYKPFQYYIQL